jgi:hypothetical protein
LYLENQIGVSGLYMPHSTYNSLIRGFFWEVYRGK